QSGLLKTGRSVGVMEQWNTGTTISVAFLRRSVTPLAPYGFNQKAPQGENQQAQTAQEAASASSQEAHLAEVNFAAGPFIVMPRQRCGFAAAARGLLYRMSRCPDFAFAALVLSACLAAGCRTAPANTGARGGEPAAQAGGARE